MTSPPMASIEPRAGREVGRELPGLGVHVNVIRAPLIVCSVGRITNEVC
jgi:hypothetical protein